MAYLIYFEAVKLNWCCTMLGRVDPFFPQRYHELDDQSEQERRAVRAREKEREKRERDLERKAREQADQRECSGHKLCVKCYLWCVCAPSLIKPPSYSHRDPFPNPASCVKQSVLLH